MRRDQDLGEINKILEAGMANVPQPLDAEKCVSSSSSFCSSPALTRAPRSRTLSLFRTHRPKYYVPRNPYATPTYYPQEPSSQFASPALFAKLDVDTLFYIFYYCPGTYLQCVPVLAFFLAQTWRAARELTPESRARSGIWRRTSSRSSRGGSTSSTSRGSSAPTSRRPSPTRTSRASTSTLTGRVRPFSFLSSAPYPRWGCGLVLT